jgi:arylsulfatase A-like enzyme
MRQAVVGKWQLGGDAATIEMLGFDEHCLWNIQGVAGERYVSPALLTNGESLEYPGQYGPELQQDFAKRFIMQHVDRPFFLYYPMTLPPTTPFSQLRTPSDWDPDRDPSFNDPNYFGEMVAYLDYLVGDLVETVDGAGLAENTLILFTADNGTDHRITSFQEGVAVRGAKGKMTVDCNAGSFFGSVACES